MEASPGASYTVMTTVLTTAMHGEKFRWVRALGVVLTGLCIWQSAPVLLPSALALRRRRSRFPTALWCCADAF